MPNDAICIPCRGGFHSECDLYFAGLLGGEQDCCCMGLFTLDDMELLRQANGPVEPTTREVLPPRERTAPNPGYVHPDAWRFKKSMGDFADPTSSGRKLVAEMYVITPGMVCEWANKENAGGGVHPIIGCLGNPASELHHGPDKNTLNNAKRSWGVGDTENIHIICSYCHNRWHAVNDPTYPPYDRIADQALPWVPEGVWGGHEPREANQDELWAENRRRAAERASKGGSAGGRGALGTGSASDVQDFED